MEGEKIIILCIEKLLNIREWTVGISQIIWKHILNLSLEVSDL